MYCPEYKYNIKKKFDLEDFTAAGLHSLHHKAIASENTDQRYIHKSLDVAYSETKIQDKVYFLWPPWS